MNDSDYSKLFGLSLAAIFAFVPAFHAIALSNAPQPIASPQSDQRVGNSGATQPCLPSDLSSVPGSARRRAEELSCRS
jgi:hypothetical protein